MKVKVLYFAQFREAANQSDETLEVASDCSAGDLLRSILVKFPSLAGLKDRVAIAVNQEVVQGKTRLKDGDEVAFLSPLSGG